MITLVFALCLHCYIIMSMRENAKQQFPVLNCFTSCCRFEYWIEGVWVKDRLVVLGTHTVTRSCWLGHCRTAGWAPPWLYDAELLYKNHFWVLLFLFLKTLVGLRWTTNDLHKALKRGIRAALQLSQYVYNWIINHVLSLRCWVTVCYLAGASLCLVCVIHGNSCPLGQLPAIEQLLNRRSVTDHNPCEAHMSISVLCIPMRVKGSIWIVSIVFPEFMSLLGGLLMWPLWWFLKASCIGP